MRGSEGARPPARAGARAQPEGPSGPDSIGLEPGVFLRIPAGTKRKLHAGSEGIEMLVVGACPGKTYEINEVTELTAA